MNADQRDEIAASVAARAELGSRYDDAIAEGLVERIGEEIDKRVDARLHGLGQAPGAAPSRASGKQRAAGQPALSVPDQGREPAAYARQDAPPAHRGTVAHVTGMFLGLGSMGLGVGVTAAVVSHHVQPAAAFGMVLLIWLAIAVINVANARRR